MIYKLEEIDKMEGHDFEYLCAELLRESGYKDVRVTQGSGDYGVDILAKKDDFTVAFQCKRFSNSVGVKAIQEIISGSVFYECDVAVVITNNEYTPQAEEMAKRARVQLWGRGKLHQLIYNHNQKEQERLQTIENQSGNNNQISSSKPEEIQEVKRYSNNMKTPSARIGFNIVVTVLLLSIFPLGLFLMWKYTNWHSELKAAITLFYVALFVLSFFPTLDAIVLVLLVIYINYLIISGKRVE